MKKPSPALVVAFIALFVALGGTTYAAVQINGSQIVDGTIATAKLRNGAVSTSKLRNGAVSTPKLRNGAVTAGKLAPSLRRRVLTGAPAGAPGAKGETGPQGPAGARGETGPQGPAGSDATVAGIAAGGALTGNYPDPGIAPEAVDTAALAPGAVTSDRLALTAVADAKSVVSQVIPANSCKSFGGVPMSAPPRALLIPVLTVGNFPEQVNLPVTTVAGATRADVRICNSATGDQDTGPFEITYYTLAL